MPEPSETDARALSTQRNRGMGTTSWKAIDAVLSRPPPAITSGWIVVGAQDPATSRHAYWADSGLKAEVTADTVKIRLGCAIKLLTALTAGTLVSGCSLVRNTKFEDWLPRTATTHKTHRYTTMRELLSHTHGLDGSNISHSEIHSTNGHDIRALDMRVSQNRPLFLPGKMYSYSDCGFWIATAILEAVTGEPYEYLLERCLQPYTSSVNVVSSPMARICPAADPIATISVHNLLSILSCFTDPPTESNRTLLDFLGLDRTLPLPGWSLRETGACVGLKSFGSGWYGHDAVMPNSIAFVRVHPRTGLRLVLSGTAPNSLPIMSLLLRELIPELPVQTPPRLIPVSESESVHAQGLAGTYCDSRHTIRIFGQDGKLTFAENREERRTELIPAERNLFFSRARPRSIFKFIQFVETERGDIYLWNGSFLLRKEPDYQPPKVECIN